MPDDDKDKPAAAPKTALEFKGMDSPVLVERDPVLPLIVPDWLASRKVRRMDAEQRGWFFQLLLEAFWNGEPQGCLPADDEELKHLAGYSALPPNSIRRALIMHGVPEDVLADAYADEAARWQKVRDMFVPVAERPELVHNNKLSRIIAQLVAERKTRYRVAQTAASKRYGNKPLFSFSMQPSPANKLGKHARQNEVLQNERVNNAQLDAGTSSPPVTPSPTYVGTTNSNLNNSEEIVVGEGPTTERTWIPNDYRPTREQWRRLIDVAFVAFHDLKLEEVEPKLEGLLVEFRNYWIEMREIDRKSRRRDSQRVSWYLTFTNRVKTEGARYQRQRAQDRMYDEKKEKNSSGNTATGSARRGRVSHEEIAGWVQDLQGSGGQDAAQAAKPGLELDPGDIKTV